MNGFGDSEGMILPVSLIVSKRFPEPQRSSIESPNVLNNHLIALFWPPNVGETCLFLETFMKEDRAVFDE